MNISEYRHPLYYAKLESWTKWRECYESGDAFIDNYLKKFSNNESMSDFATRKSVTYVPAFAKSSINEIKNSIFQRANDIRREGGTLSYKKAIMGEGGGVDLNGSSMVKMLNDVVTELLVMGKVGVFIDMPRVQVMTKADLTDDIHPYCYIVRAEDILSWSYKDGKLDTALIRVYVTTLNEDGLPKSIDPEYRLIQRNNIRIFNVKGEEIDNVNLEIAKMPFVIAEINDSLLKDVSNYQIALLNLASSDMNFALKGNFPFYTEQYDPRAEIADRLRKSADGTNSNDSNMNEVEIGGLHGRRYGINLERPAFIAPPSHPLEVSMKKQEQMKEEIRQLVHLALASLRPKMVSAEAMSLESEGLESGLAYIGIILESIERQIAEVWNAYENQDLKVVVSYPKRYALKSDKERILEAKERLTVINKIPSNIFKKEALKDIAIMILGSKVDHETMEQVLKEIESSTTVNVDPELLLKCVENSLVSDKTASELIGFPENEAELAAEDHAKRIARIIAAQTADSKGARGDNITSLNRQASKQEKRRNI